jgi:hypothetical protein
MLQRPTAPRRDPRATSMVNASTSAGVLVEAKRFYAEDDVAPPGRLPGICPATYDLRNSWPGRVAKEVPRVIHGFW